MWGILAFVIGLLYGWLKPGRQNKLQMLKTGILIGLVVGVVLALIGMVAGMNPFSLGQGILETILAAILIALLFILGVWIGDIIEGKTGKTRRTA